MSWSYCLVKEQTCLNLILYAISENKACGSKRLIYKSNKKLLSVTEENGCHCLLNYEQWKVKHIHAYRYNCSGIALSRLPGRRAGAPPLWQLARSFPVTGPQPLSALRRAGNWAPDDTTLMAESEELKSLLMKMKENEKVGLKLNFQKTKFMASDSSLHGK